MKTLKKIILWLFAGVASMLLIFVGVGVYLRLETPDCTTFQTHFLGKDIVFPISLEQAAKKYNLKHNGIVGYSLTEKDTLLVVDSHHISDRGIYGAIFYLREMNPKSINDLKNSLEFKYGKKFKKKPPYHGYEYIQINECVFLVICFQQYTVNDIAQSFVKEKLSFGNAKITCRISFFHNIAEDAIPGMSGESGRGIGIYPSHMGIIK